MLSNITVNQSVVDNLTRLVTQDGTLRLDLLDIYTPEYFLAASILSVIPVLFFAGLAFDYASVRFERPGLGFLSSVAWLGVGCSLWHPAVFDILPEFTPLSLWHIQLVIVLSFILAGYIALRSFRAVRIARADKVEVSGE